MMKDQVIGAAQHFMTTIKKKEVNKAKAADPISNAHVNYISDIKQFTASKPSTYTDTFEQKPLNVEFNYAGTQNLPNPKKNQSKINKKFTWSRRINQENICKVR